MNISRTKPMSSDQQPNKDGEKFERAGVTNMAPTRSRVREIERLDLNSEPVNLVMDTDKPVAFVEDPGRIVPHEEVPKKLKDAIISEYGMAFFEEKEWTVATLKRLAKAVNSPRENITNSLAQVCGPNCKNRDNCPHDIVGKAPIGERCPIELKLMKLLYEEYILSVSERLGTEPDQLREDIIPHNLIMGLVEADIVSMRLDGSIAHEGYITDVPVAVNENTGQVFSRDEEAIPVRIKERVRKQRDQIYRQLLATPEMAEKYKRRGSQDAMARTASLIDRLEKIVGSAENDSNIIDAEVIDDDITRE